MEIESVRELQKLLKSCQLTVNSVEQLEGLLRQINAGYDPDAARVRAARRIGTLVPIVGAVMAFMTSFYLVPISLVAPDRTVPFWPRVTACLGGLGIVWGLWATVSIVAVLRSFSLLRGWPTGSRSGQVLPPLGPASTAITSRSLNVTRAENESGDRHH